MQYRRDRDTGEAFEVLDGLMLKDGYLYKKVAIDSLNFWGLMPSEDELLKFEPCKKEEPDSQEWLTQLFGEQKKKRMRSENGGGNDKVGGKDKGGGKGEGSSSASMSSNFEVHDLVVFGLVPSHLPSTIDILYCQGTVLCFASVVYVFFFAIAVGRISVLLLALRKRIISRYMM